MAEPILNPSRVAARIHLGVAAGVAQHVGVDRKGEAGADTDALNQPIHRVKRERTAAFGGEDEGRIRRLPAQFTRCSRLVAVERLGRGTTPQACGSTPATGTIFSKRFSCGRGRP
jgi:hypothetical protein